MAPKSKTNVIKSKSSNNAADPKINTENKYYKKSNSNAYIQPVTSKKRGVYVEKNSNKTESSKSKEGTENVLPLIPSSQRELEKLQRSKSNTNIRCMTVTEERYPELESERNKTEQRENEVNRENKKTQNVTIRSKYISNILNQRSQERLKVITSRKDITDTPSMYSTSSKKYLCKESSTTEIKFNLNDEVIIAEYNDTNKNLPIDFKAVTKKALGNHWFEEKSKKIKRNSPRKEEKQVYNFFVDLLHTTLEGSHIKLENKQYEECEDRLSDASIGTCSSIVKKIDSENGEVLETFNDVSKSVTFPKIGIESTNTNDRGISEYEYVRNLPVIPNRQRSHTMKAMPVFDNKHTKSPKRTKSVMTKRPLRGNKELLRMLRQQLQIDNLEEPKNMHEALKVLVHNKKTFKKKLRFNESVETDGDKYKDPGCTFKRRNLISRTKKRKNNTPATLDMYLTSVSSQISAQTTKGNKYSRKKSFEYYKDEKDLSEPEVYYFDDKLSSLSGSTFENNFNAYDDNMVSCVSKNCKTYHNV